MAVVGLVVVRRLHAAAKQCTAGQGAQGHEEIASLHTHLSMDEAGKRKQTVVPVSGHGVVEERQEFFFSLSAVLRICRCPAKTHNWAKCAKEDENRELRKKQEKSALLCPAAKGAVAGLQSCFWAACAVFFLALFC